MIQLTQGRRISESSSYQRAAPIAKPDSVLQWGQWFKDRYYTVEVVQHPLRARTCGFGDKDRRPLAPAAVAKLVVKDRYDREVKPDDIDVSFFIMSIDLWNEDATQELNLVLLPSPGSDKQGSSNRPSFGRVKSERGKSTSPRNESSSRRGYSLNSEEGQRSSEAGITLTAPYPDPWIHIRPTSPPLLGESMSSRDMSLPPFASLDVSLSSAFPGMPSSGYSPWSDNASDLRPSSFHLPPLPSLQSTYNNTLFSPSRPPPLVALVPSQRPSSPPAPSAPRHAYTRTLVGPLTANASKLKDEHRQLGIFFIFQDLSVRTEGTFRLRMRLMNVEGATDPETGAPSITTGKAPVLAQIFTGPFTVYSAKRFPGVPEMTALSIAFGNQGQKLHLRNQNLPPYPMSYKVVHGGRSSDSDEESKGPSTSWRQRYSR